MESSYGLSNKQYYEPQIQITQEFIQWVYIRGQGIPKTYKHLCNFNL